MTFSIHLIIDAVSPEKYGYDEGDILVMSDDPDHRLDPLLKPSRENIVRSRVPCFGVSLIALQLKRIDLLVRGAKSGDQFFFYCMHPNFLANSLMYASL